MMKYKNLHGYKYELQLTYRITVDLPNAALPGKLPYVQIDGSVLSIRKNYMWDGPSGISIDTLNFMRGSLVHDALYQLMREEYLDKKYRDYADRMLQTICLEDGMSSFRAWYVYQAVHLFAAGALKPEKNPRGKITIIEDK
jgi:hypothetical protein